MKKVLCALLTIFVLLFSLISYADKSISAQDAIQDKQIPHDIQLCARGLAAFMNYLENPESVTINAISYMIVDKFWNYDMFEFVSINYADQGIVKEVVISLYPENALSSLYDVEMELYITQRFPKDFVAIFLSLIDNIDEQDIYELHSKFTETGDKEFIGLTN